MYARIVVYAITICMCASCASVVPSRGETVVLVRDGKAAATIVVPGDAGGDEQKAGQMLSAYIKRLCGVALPVRDSSDGVVGVRLFVGPSDRSSPIDMSHPNHGLESASRECFAIRVRDGDVFFSGRTSAAVCYAVLSFIEDDLGVRWFAPGGLWEYLPQCDEGELTVNLKDRTVVPDTPLRKWVRHDFFDSWKQWDWRNRASTRSKRIRDRLGNQFQGVYPVESYGKTHPEYYPLVRGKRFVPPPGRLTRHMTFWPCSSNPEVATVAADFLRRWFDEDPENRRSFSLGMDDVTNICECENCRAMDQPGDFEKDQFSERNYTFVNSVAREVKKTHPNHYIGVLIYRQLRQPPVTVTRMEDNVYGFLTSNCATWWNPGTEEADKKLAQDWARRFKLPLGRYEYYGLGTFTPRFYPHTMDRQVKFDRQLGFASNHTEVCTFLPHTAPMIWAFAKLQWDASKDIDDLLGEFYAKMFGAAAPTMGEYYALLERAWNVPRPGRTRDFSNTAGQLAVSRNRNEQVLAISPKEIKAGLALLDRALEESDDPRVKKRIDIVRAALVFSQHGIETYLFNTELRTRPINSKAEVQQALADLRQYNSMAKERERFWSQSRQRDDILGETIRGLGDQMKYLIIDEFPQLDTYVSSLALAVLEWQREHDPDGLQQVQNELLNIPWTDTLDDAMSTVTLAQGGRNRLKNTGFERSAQNKNTKAAYEGVPDKWSLWIRNKPSHLNRSKVGIMPKVGRNDSRGFVYESGQGGVLMQSLRVKPGEVFLCTAWVRAVANEEAKAAGNRAADTARRANIHAIFHDAKGNVVAPDRRMYANSVFGDAIDGWQRLALSIKVPARVVSLTIMIGTHEIDAPGTSVIFDDVTLLRSKANKSQTSKPIKKADVKKPLKWNPQTVAAELNRYKPILDQFGIKDPLRWARADMESETDWAAAQSRWERRIAHWRFMLLDEEPADWARWLNLDHPALGEKAKQLKAGGKHARRKTTIWTQVITRAWAAT